MEHNAYNAFDPNLSSDFPARKWKVDRQPPLKVAPKMLNEMKNKVFAGVCIRKYKARAIKQWWCARIHIFKMDGWARDSNELYGNISCQGRGGRLVKKFLTRELEACLLSLSLAHRWGGREFFSVLQWGRRSGRYHQPSQSGHELWLSVFLKVADLEDLGWRALSLALICRKYFPAHSGAFPPLPG